MEAEFWGEKREAIRSSEVLRREEDSGGRRDRVEFGKEGASGDEGEEDVGRVNRVGRCMCSVVVKFRSGRT